jgi:hypothetical protein
MQKGYEVSRMKEEQVSVRWDEERELVMGRPTGIIDETVARIILREVESMATAHGPEVDWVIDLTEMTTATARGRTILMEATAHQSIRHCSFWGASAFVRIMTNFIFLAIGRDNCRHFRTEEKALQWLQEGNE